MDISKKLKNRRKEIGLTMLELAQKVGVSEATISRWESGDIANMRRDKIASLANALQVTPAFIMGWDETEPLSAIKHSPEEITLDDFSYAMYNEMKELSEEDKKALLDMAKIFKKRLDNKDK